MAAERFGYCGKLRRSTVGGSYDSFVDVCFVTEPEFPQTTKNEITLEDTGDCSRDSGYSRKMPSPLKSIEPISLTINYDPNDVGHKLIFDDFALTSAPETLHYWQWYDTSNNDVVWTCRAYVSDIQSQAARDTAAQLTFTLTFSGKPIKLSYQDVG